MKCRLICLVHFSGYMMGIINNTMNVYTVIIVTDTEISL